MVITDATRTQLTANQICFKECIKYLKYNGDSGHNGDRTYSTTYTTTTTTTTSTTTTTNNNIILVVVVYVILNVVSPLCPLSPLYLRSSYY